MDKPQFPILYRVCAVAPISADSSGIAGLSGKDPDAADSDDRKDGLLGSDPEAGGGGAPAEGSPRAAEVTAAESGTGAGAEGEPRVEQQQHVGVKTRSCTIL